MRSNQKAAAKLLSLLLSCGFLLQTGGSMVLFAETTPEIQEDPETAWIETEAAAEEELTYGAALALLADAPLLGAGAALNDTTTYVIFRYHHPDGSVYSEFSELSDAGDTVTVDVAEKDIRDNETYTGYLVAAGLSAVSADGTSITVGATPGVSTVKVEVYYSTETVGKHGGMVDPAIGFDTVIDEHGHKIYDTFRMGIHTDKTAEAVGQDENGNTRSFDLTLESWYVDKSADVAMVVDASGSMAWPIDKMSPITASGTVNTLLSDAAVDQVLDKNYTDNSLLQYSGYRYFVYDTYNNEYVALGYVDYIDSSKKAYNNGSLIGTANAVGPSGWYYVNTTSNKDMRNGSPYSMKLYQNNKASSYTLGNRTVSIPANSAAKFYIDNDGMLHCLFFYQSQLRDSLVYVYDNGIQGQTKVEALQESIGVYQSIMSSLMPSSHISMTRFSSDKFAEETNGQPNEFDKLVMLDWTSDSQALLNAVSQGYGNASTAGTESGAYNTLYNYYLTGGTFSWTGVRAFQNYLQGTANGERPDSEANKYLILFTDGRDQEPNFTNIKDEIAALKNAGYKIMTVFLESDGMTDKQVNESVAFLRGLATVDADNKTLFYHAVSNNNPSIESTYEPLNDIFVDIAKYISDALTDYTIVDYIDPRFDLVDNGGNPVTVLDENGSFTDRQITTADGKTATVKYDADAKMFYIEWTMQDIPTAMQGTVDLVTENETEDSGSIKVWSSTIHLQAKEDFLGGNDVFTNGNGENQNKVYHPGYIDNGTDASVFPAKDFPRTTADPALLHLDILDIEDTFFLGETVKVDNFDTYYNEIVDNSHYIRYLKRLALYEGKAENYYISQLINEGSLELDYHYIPNDGDSTSYAGGVETHQEERFGKLKYRWVQIDEDGTAHEVSDYGEILLESTDKLHYRLEITYTADSEENRDPSTIRTGGTTLVRPPVGAEQTEEQENGKCAINVVDGQLRVDKRLNHENLQSIVGSLGERTLIFDIVRSYDDESSRYASVEIRTDGQQAVISVFSPDGTPVGESKTVDLQALAHDADGNIIIQSDPLTGLPIGTYTITERPCAPYAVTNAAGVNTEDDPDTAFVESSYLCGSSATDTSVSLYIGQVFNGTPDARYTDTPTVGDKYYLNARVGEGMLTNTWLYSIPSAGGSGTYWFTFAGTMLSAFALFRLRKRREQRPHV